MRRITRRRPSPAMIVAIVALVAALGGTAVAAGTISVGDFNKKTKQKTVGVGKLTYVSSTKTIPGGGNAGGGTNVPVSATCPSGLHVIGGGIEVPEPNPTGPNNDDIFIMDSYPTATGWAGRVANYASASFPATATTTAICAASQSVTGAPPSS